MGKCVTILHVKGVNIYVTVTTIDGKWREKLAEIHTLQLKEACFFPTCLNEHERQEAYELLEKSEIDHIPLVHIRSDFYDWEIEYLEKKFGTKVFNAHSQMELPFEHDLSHYKKLIALETGLENLEKELPNFAGICPDFSHLENFKRLGKPIYASHMRCLEKYPRLAAHASAIRQEGRQFDYHQYNDLSEFDYLKSYKKYLPPIVALELENSIGEQLEAKKYIEKLLGSSKWKTEAGRRYN
jgi:hypothetical protein